MVTNEPDNKTKSKLLPIHVYFKENFKIFLTETSLNGLKYCQDMQRNFWERCLYVISFSILFSAGIYMASYFFHKWQGTPDIISISPETTSMQEMPFPTVTICNMNQALASKAKNIKPDTPEYAMLQNICFQNYNYALFKNFKRRFANDSLTSFKLKNSQSCNEMIIYCKFGGFEEPCSNLFRDVFLDEGLCCAFNLLHPFFLFKGKTRFIRDYTSLNGLMTVPVNWNLETGYEKPLPLRYYPMKSRGPGSSFGLTVILNANISEYYCSSTNGAGFKVLLYNPVDTPQIRENGLPIMIGHQTRVRVITKLLQAHPSLRNIPSSARKCYFSTEKKLIFYKSYTRRSCESECDSLQMLRKCNCIPFYMPHIYANASRCFLSETDCVRNTALSTLDPQLLECKEGCLPGCHDLLYFPDMFVTSLARTNYSLHNKVLRSVSKEMIAENLALVQIYYSESHVRGFTKMPYTQLTDFLSQIGGVMSLMVGFSVISVAEAIYFILLKPFLDILMKRSPLILKNTDSKLSKKDNFAKNEYHPQKLFKHRKNINNRVILWDKGQLQKY